MSAALISLAADVGAPLVAKVLSDKLGGASGELASDVLRVIAGRSGIAEPDIEAQALENPEVVRAAIEDAEAVLPELLRVHELEAENHRILLQAEARDPLWARAWRPLGMYLIGWLWLWNVVVLHVANAVFKIALPPMDLAILLQLSGFYMAFYMGGHTAKDIAGKWLSGSGLPIGRRR